MNLSICMQFVNKHRSSPIPTFDWVNELLKVLMATMQPEQRETLLDGYALHYQLTIYVVPYNDQGLIENLNINRLHRRLTEKRGNEQRSS